MQRAAKTWRIWLLRKPAARSLLIGFRPLIRRGDLRKEIGAGTSVGKRMLPGFDDNTFVVLTNIMLIALALQLIVIDGVWTLLGRQCPRCSTSSCAFREHADWDISRH